MWELEERHLQEKHQQLKQQLKDQYFLQRHQLLKRHEKVRERKESRARPKLSGVSAREAAEMKTRWCACGGRRWNRCSATTSGWSRK